MRYVKDMRLSSICKNRCELWRTETSTEKNRLGQYPKTDIKVMEFWAAILPQSGGLLNNRPADTLLTRTTHKIVCRYNDKINSSDWIIYNGTRYDIIYIQDPYLNNERLEIFVEVVQ